uniref:B3 domain-containing protein n=1 Tax=Populus alba TaxID=43335 RepID=A0A4V6A1E9_POPAL|nr:hypothetical protein D5086_0000288890 [Populus alba]
MARLCGCGQSDHHIFIADMNIDEYDDGSFDQLFEKYRQETDDNDEAFTLMEKEIVMGLLWMRNNGAKRESSKSRSTSPSSDGSSYAQFTHPLVILPVIPKKKRSGDQGFLYPKKSPSSYDNCQDDDEDHHHILEDEEGTVSGWKERGSGILNGVVKKNKYSKTSVADEVKKEGRQKEKRMNRTNRKRCFALEDIEEEEGMRSTSKRRKGDSRALDLGFDFSDEIKALIGEDGDEDFKLRIRKKLYQTDTSAHHDRFTMPCRQINECESLLTGDEKTNICQGDGIGVTLVELGLGDEKDSTFTSQLRLKQWNMKNSSSYALRSSWNDVMVRNVGALHQDDYAQIYSFRRNGELWFVLVKESDHEEGRKDGVFGRTRSPQGE